MIDLAATIEGMKQAGMSHEDILTALACIKVEPVVVKDEKAEARRERDRLRKASLPSNWSSIRLQVIARDGFVCAYCGEVTDDIHIDHVMPLSRGGSSEMGNLVVACPTCNVSKKDKTPEEWGARQ